MGKSVKSKNSDAKSYSWEHLLDTDSTAGDIDSIVSRELGPLHRPPNLVNLRKNIIQGDESFLSRRTANRGLGIVMEGDETLVSHYSLRDVVQQKSDKLTPRVVLVWLVVGMLCVASFATSNMIIDTFSLRPADIAQASQQSLQSQIINPMVNPSQRFIQLRRVLFYVSGQKSLGTWNSPQVRALDWLANRDDFNLPSDSPNLVQRYALAVLYYSTNEDGWHRDLEWLTPKHECEWSAEGGVRSCNKNKEVTDLSLWNNLKGTIPSEIFKLTKLQVLYLARNQLRGTIPSEIGLLSDLTYLGLHHNKLTGTVPSLPMGNMLKLKTLYLEKNDLTGMIRRVDPLCQLKTEDPKAPKDEKRTGSLERVTADCRSLVKWKEAQIKCGCCTKCYL